jgi:hypothetical protein
VGTSGVGAVAIVRVRICKVASVWSEIRAKRTHNCLIGLAWPGSWAHCCGGDRRTQGSGRGSLLNGNGEGNVPRHGSICSGDEHGARVAVGRRC